MYKRQIDVCRQQEHTREQAEQLAKRQKRWKLLVLIYVESETPQCKRALDILSKNISNLRDQVDILQAHATSFFGECERQQRLQANVVEHADRIRVQDIKAVAFKIVAALVNYHENQGTFVGHSFESYELLPGQQVLVEDVLQAFVDHQ